MASAEKVDLRHRIADYQAGEKNERDAERRLQFVISRLSADEVKAFDLDAWKAQVPGFNLPLSDLCASGDGWRRFSAALHEIESMLRGRTPTYDLLGLPLASLKAAAVQAAAVKREEDARRAEEALEAARLERVANMRNLAHRELRSEADEWLNRQNILGLTLLECAAEGLFLDRLYDEIYELGERRKQRLKAERIVEEHRNRLRAAVLPAFGHDERRANLFLKSSQPTLNGQSPLAYCRDERTLAYCLSLMSQQARPHR